MVAESTPTIVSTTDKVGAKSAKALRQRPWLTVMSGLLLFFGLGASLRNATMQHGFERLQREVVEVAPASPRVEVPTSMIDVGVVRQGVAVRHLFVIANVGAGDLLLNRIDSTCGCTVAVKDTDILVHPGQTTSIPVSVDTSSFREVLDAGLRMRTNDSQSPEITLRITGRVEALFRHPLLVQLERNGEGSEARIVVETQSGETITAWRPTGSALTVELVERISGLVDRWTFRASHIGESVTDMPLGSLAIETTSIVVPSIMIPILPSGQR
jgi:hypothetical protein